MLTTETIATGEVCWTMLGGAIAAIAGVSVTLAIEWLRRLLCGPSLELGYVHKVL